MEQFKSEYTKLLSLPINRAVEYDDVGIEATSSEEQVKWMVLQTKLNDAKSLLDNAFKSKHYSIVKKLFDVYRGLRFDERLDIEHLSNAWFKLNEMIGDFDLLNKSKMVTFSNCEFPGSFICNLRYLSEVRKIDLQWYGSSFLEGTVDDTYGLYREFPNNWIMDNTCKGDMTNPAQVQEIARRFRQKHTEGCDLYTADGGMDATQNYNMQETINMQLHLGQMICGFLSTKKGGSMVLKQYSWFTPRLQSMIVYMSSLFDKFVITKPVTSRPENSEVYLVGVGFKGIGPASAKKLLQCLGHKQAIVDLSEYDLDPLYNILDLLIGRQVAFLEERVQVIKDYPRRSTHIHKTAHKVRTYVTAVYFSKYM